MNHHIAALMVTLAAASGAAAQLTNPGTTTAPRPGEAAAGEEPPRLTLQLTPRAEHTFESDLRDLDGSASVSRIGANLSARFAATDRLRLTLGVDGEYSWYDFSGTGPAPAGLDLGDLMDDAAAVDFTPGFQYGIDEKWTVLGGAIIEYSGQSGAEVGDSMTYGGFGGVRYAFSEKFALTLGAAVKSRLEDDAFFAPIIGLEWRISDKVRLATERLGAKLSVRASEQVWVWLSGGYELRDYRLEDDNVFAPGGVLTDARVPIRIGVDWTPSTRFTLQGFVGVVVFQEYEVLNDDGDELFDDETDPAAMLGVRATFTF